MNQAAGLVQRNRVIGLQLPSTLHDVDHSQASIHPPLATSREFSLVLMIDLERVPDSLRLPRP